MRPGEIDRLTRDTLYAWFNHSAFQLAAAMAYYALFSIAPLLLIAIWMAGLVFGEEAARAGVMDQIRALVGDTGAAGIDQMLRGAQEGESRRLAGLLGVLVILLGASGVFGQLKLALNTIWEAPTPKGGLVRAFLRDRFLSFAMVLVIGFLLLVSLLLSTALSAAGTWFGGLLPESAFLLEGVNFVVSSAIITLLFALIFKIIPDARIRWRDVWIGALFSALLFTFGKSLIGLYLGRSAMSSAYGAGGSLVVVLLWVYYSSLLLLLGAEFTHIQALHRRAGRPGAERAGAPPSRDARRQRGA